MSDLAWDQAEALVLTPFLRVLDEELHAETDSQERDVPFEHRMPHRVREAPLVQVLHGSTERADTRENERLCRL